MTYGDCFHEKCHYDGVVLYLVLVCFVDDARFVDDVYFVDDVRFVDDVCFVDLQWHRCSCHGTLYWRKSF